MNEMENIQPEENLETTEAVETTETVAEQALEDTTHEPGARVEETQTFEQAEAVEEALVEAVEAAPAEVAPPPEDEEDMQLISGPSRDDLPPGTGILEEPHETVAMAEGLEERGLADVAEVPEGTEFQLAEDDGSVGRDDHPMADPSELSEAKDDDKDEATPINLPGPVAEEDDEDMQLISGPDRDDLPPGTGILEEPHETVAMAEGLDEPGLADVAEVPEGTEFQLAEDDGSVGRDDHPMADPSELSEAKDDDKDEATPINLPGPVAGVADDPDHGPNPLENLTKDHPGPGGNVASEDDWESPNVNVALDHTGPGGMVAEEPEPGPDPFSPPALDHPGPGGRIAQDPVPEPDPDFNVALDHPGTGGNIAGHKEPGDPPAPPDFREQSKLSPDDVKLAGQTELSPDDVKIKGNLQPAPDFDDMTPAEESVVDIIGKAIADEDYRGVLFTDVETAVRGYQVSDQDQTALGEMTGESFDFFAAEVEKRLSEALAGLPDSDILEAKQQLLKQTVHAVWRDLNPGGLMYVLTYKIPQKHL